MTHIPPAETLAAYIADGHTMVCVARRLGISEATVRRRLHAAGLPRPTRGRPCCIPDPAATVAPAVTTGTYLTGNRWPTWYADAVCAQTDPEEFFPGPGEPTRYAKAICGVCPALADCLAFAVANPALTGIWGGTTDRQRQAMRKKERAA